MEHLEEKIETVVNALVYIDAKAIIEAKKQVVALNEQYGVNEQRTIAFEAFTQVLED